MYAHIKTVEKDNILNAKTEKCFFFSFVKYMQSLDLMPATHFKMLGWRQIYHSSQVSEEQSNTIADKMQTPFVRKHRAEYIRNVRQKSETGTGRGQSIRQTEYQRKIQIQ